MKVVGLVSGGKDSCYAMMRCIDYGHEIVALANLLPLEDSIDELDSYMYQTVGHQIVISYAECMGLPLFRRRIQGSSRHQHLSYSVTSNDEVEDMFILLNEVKQQIPSITAVSSGAIASDYQRLRVESVCSRLGLVSLAYLWKQDQAFLLEDMIRKGIMAILVKVAAIGLDPAKHLGRDIADLQAQLLQLKELYGINVCGEGGEYETLTLNCPLFKNARIVLDNYQVVLYSADSIAPVGILHPLASHLEPKTNSLTSNSTYDRKEFDPEIIARVYEVRGEREPDDIVNCLPVNIASNTTAEERLQISRTEGDTFSMGCWIQNSSTTSDGVQGDLTAILRKIELELSEDGFEWANVLYIHLYISDMNEFALANEVYLRFISEKKCFWGVPSRSTIELPLTQVGLGNAYVEVLLTNDQSKRVLHVQSISCWAPSCIGPYSQATLHKELLHMAGQLGLDPPTMTLCSGGPAAEMDRALENCEAVATCFNCSVASSAILFVIYCSASITATKRIEIQHKMESFLGPKLSNFQSSGFSRGPPLFLYVLVPNLPKRALVEVKPVLYIPKDRETILPTIVRCEACEGVEKDSAVEHSYLYDSCCQKYIVSGKICISLVSITNDIVAVICSRTDQNSEDFCHYSSGEQIKRIAKFCTRVVSKILLENAFSWKDVKNLRIYFNTTLCASVEILNVTFSEAFGESGKPPIFNLIPVLSSGRSAAMDDFITCELFASKF